MHVLVKSRVGIALRSAELSSYRNNGFSDPFVRSCPLSPSHSSSLQKGLLLQVIWPPVCCRQQRDTRVYQAAEPVSLLCIHRTPLSAELTGLIFLCCGFPSMNAHSLPTLFFHSPSFFDLLGFRSCDHISS